MADMSQDMNTLIKLHHGNTSSSLLLYRTYGGATSNLKSPSTSSTKLSAGQCVQVFDSKMRLLILHPVYIAYPAGSAYMSSYVVPADI